MKAKVPGKLILSGEHAVVHGAPAIVTAVELFATCELERDPASVIMLDLQNLDTELVLTPEDLTGRLKNIRNKVDAFEKGRIAVRDILSQPKDLSLYALAIAMEFTRRGAQGTSSTGLRGMLASDIPVGCGMGSSAAIIVATIQALFNIMNKAAARSDIFQLALQAEKAQHGYASGVDPRIAIETGALRYEKGGFQSIKIPRHPLVIAQSGRPMSGTGECVAEVSEKFAGDKHLWQSFRSVSEAIEKSLGSANPTTLQDAVRENHRLLCHIGVVPDKVQHFIKRVEKAGGAAKICGAGSTRGDKAGVIWVLGIPGDSDLFQAHGYESMTVHPYEKSEPDD